AHLDAGSEKRLSGLVVFALAVASRRIEHHANIDPTLVGCDHRIDSVGSVDRNILMFKERLAALIGSRIALTVSSGRTMSVCDIFLLLDEAGIGQGLRCIGR